jgi:hypothetical protein
MVEEDDWRKLCQQAATEQDPKRLLQLTEQINRITGPEGRSRTLPQNRVMPRVWP